MISRPICDYNVLFVTMDCCRYDTLVAANVPTIKSLGSVRKAQSYGSYTLPSHISMFAGYLPNVMDMPGESYYSREVSQLWRLSGARAKESRVVGITFPEHDILRGYQMMGYYLVGAGGTRWFRNDVLTRGFDQFFYYGNDDYADVFSPRESKHFALTHLDELLGAIQGKEKWLMFINAHETHAPYDTGEREHTKPVLDLLDFAKPSWGGKSLRVGKIDYTQAVLNPLKMAQIKAAETIDQRLARLLDALPRPVLVVLCGDHGESFGEVFDGMPRYGHGFPSAVVMEVPMIVGALE